MGFSLKRLAPWLVLLALSMTDRLSADNWPRFRGPTGQGLSAEKDLPLKWGPDTNVAWKTPLPGLGWSSPIIWEDRIFVTTATDEGASCRVLCLERDSGRIRWNKEVFRQVPVRKERKNSHATPTPVTDGKHIYCVFSGGSFAALTFDGETVWTNHEVKFYSRHGLGASPVLHRNLLIMPFDGSKRVAVAGKWPDNTVEEKTGWRIPWDKSFIVALDTASGKRMWTARRGMSRIAHVTPLILEIDGEPQLVSVAGDVIQGFKPDTGERIWTIASEGEGVTPGIVMGDGLIFTVSGFMNNTIRTVRTGAKGNATDTHIAWETRKGVPRQASLLYVKPFLYAVADNGIVTCYRGASGEVVWQGRIGGRHCASPVHADGRIYFLSEEGETAVLQAGAEFKILAKNSISEKCQASIAISGGALFIRSEKHLFRIGK